MSPAQIVTQHANHKNNNNWSRHIKGVSMHTWQQRHRSVFVLTCQGLPFSPEGRRLLQYVQVIKLYVMADHLNVRGSLIRWDLFLHEKLELTLTIIGANSADDKLVIFFFFRENRVWHFMQIVSCGDNLHEMSNSIFWGRKKKRKIFQMSSADIFTQHADINRFDPIIGRDNE